MKHRTTQSALLVAGAAAGVAALAWVGTRRRTAASRPSTALDDGASFSQLAALHESALPEQDDEQTAVRRRPEVRQPEPPEDYLAGLPLPSLIGAESSERLMRRDTDPVLDEELLSTGWQDEAAGAVLPAEPESARPISEDISLEQIWDAGLRADQPPSEGYDAVASEDLGSVWLERATETAREDRLYTGDPADPGTLDELLVSEATRASARPWDAEQAETHDGGNAVISDDDQDPNDVQEDDLDVDEKRDSRH